MNNKKISGGSARIAQAILLMFFLPLIGLVSYIIVGRNFSFDGIMFLLFFIAIATIVLWNAFSYSDVYVSQDNIFTKKLFTSKNFKKDKVIKIESALRPFTYRIRFVTKDKVNFIATTSDLFKQAMSWDTDKGLEAIEAKILNDTQK